MASLFDKAKKPEEDEAAEGPQHEAMPNDAAEDAAEGEAPDTEGAVPEGEPSATPEGDQGGKPFTPELAQQMQAKLAEGIPTEQRAAFQKITLAAKKVMYSEQTRNMVMQAVQSEGDIDKKLASNAAGLVLLLDRESKNTMPQQLLMPAAAFIVIEAAEVALAAGAEVAAQDVADAIHQTMALIAMKYGAKGSDVMSMFQGGGQPAQPGAQAPQPGMSMMQQQDMMQGGMA